MKFFPKAPPQQFNALSVTVSQRVRDVLIPREMLYLSGGEFTPCGSAGLKILIDWIDSDSIYAIIT